MPESWADHEMLMVECDVVVCRIDNLESIVDRQHRVLHEEYSIHKCSAARYHQEPDPQCGSHVIEVESSHSSAGILAMKHCIRLAPKCNDSSKGTLCHPQTEASMWQKDITGISVTRHCPRRSGDLRAFGLLILWMLSPGQITECSWGE
jgi:hypothetical protein